MTIIPVRHVRHTKKVGETFFVYVGRNTILVEADSWVRVLSVYTTYTIYFHRGEYDIGIYKPPYSKNRMRATKTSPFSDHDIRGSMDIQYRWIYNIIIRYMYGTDTICVRTYATMYTTNIIGILIVCTVSKISGYLTKRCIDLLTPRTFDLLA